MHFTAATIYMLHLADYCFEVACSSRVFGIKLIPLHDCVMLLCCSEPSFKVSLEGSGEKGSLRNCWLGISESEHAVRNIKWGFYFIYKSQCRKST